MDKRSRSTGKAKKQPGKRPPTTPGAAARRTAGATLTARGVVRAPDGRPLAGLLVRAYDKNLRSEDSLGESVTDAEGRYEIRYRSTQPKQAPKGHADLRIAVCDPAGEEIATSDVHFNAPADVVIDVTVPAAGRGPSEYERHLDALKPAQQGLSLAELTEDAEHQDVTFLTGETGIERDHIKCLVRAARAAAARPSLPAATARTALPTEIFYGLFRQGLPTSLDELWTEPVDALITALRLSIEQNIIPSAISAQIPVARQYFELARAAHLLQPIVNGPASLGDVLRAIPGKEQLTPAEQLEFARLYDAHGSTEHLWAAVAGTALAAKRPALERTFELRALTQSHPAIIDALHRTHDAGASASIAYLASLSSAEWLDLAFTHGAPPGSDQPPVEYAAQLERAVERRFSTAVLRERLASGVVRMRSVDAAPLVAFLTEHPDFDLRTHDAGEYLDAAGIASPPLRTSLTRLQRVLPLAGSIQATAALLDEGFASASHIAAAGSDMLRARLGPAIDEPTLGDIYHAAEERADTIGALGTVLRSYIGTNTSVLPAAKLGPTLRTLFGDLDFCECRHCQSVLGPAAYLADLLHFLETSPASNGGTAFDALRQRRPDLADLELSCENTNIEIPYIDLVLEILENEVALPVAIPLTASATPDFEAELTAGRVPPAIRAALAKTATTVGDVFTVRRAPQSLLLTVPRRSEWTLSDGSRRWRVAYQSRQLVAWREVAPGFNVPRFLPSLPALDAIETELAAGTLHPDLLHALAPDTMPPVKGTPQVVAVPSTPGGAAGWKIDIQQEVQVAVVPGVPMGAVIVYAPDGQTLQQLQLPTAHLQVVTSWLTGAATSHAAAAIATLGLPPTLPYTITRDAATQRFLVSVRTSVVAAIAPRSLTVTALTFQNSSVRENLAAMPENRNPEAYEKLRQARFPWSLPLDLWLEEIRAFLSALGVSRRRLMELTRVPEREPKVFAAELLGVSAGEFTLLTGPAGAEPWTSWGLKQQGNRIADVLAGVERSGSWLEILRSVSMLMQQSRLSYRELLEVLHTGMGGQSPPLIQPRDECHPGTLLLANLTAAHLDWIHRFTRLRRRIGWTTRELDRALSAFGGIFSADAVSRLAGLRQLNERLRLPPLTLGAIVGQLENRSWTSYLADGSPVEPSLYHRHFQQAALRTSASFSAFSLNAAGELAYLATVPPPAAAQTLSSHVEFIASALAITPPDMSRLLGAAGSIGITDQLRLSNLSVLHGVVQFARALGLSIDEALRWQELLDLRPFTLAGAARVRALTDVADALEFASRSGRALEELEYLLRHRAEGPFLASQARLRDGLSEIRAALQSSETLGTAGLEHLLLQLARAGVAPPLITALRDESGLHELLRAEVGMSLTPPTVPTIPRPLRNRFYLNVAADGQTARFGCRGVMAQSEFDALAAVATGETAVPAQERQALLQQYQAVRDALVAQLRATQQPARVLLPESIARELLLGPRSDDVVPRALRSLVPALEADLLAAHVAALLGIEQGVAAALLDRVTVTATGTTPGTTETARELLTALPLLESDPAVPIDAQQFASQLVALVRMEKAALLLAPPAGALDRIEWLTSGDFEVLDINNLPASSSDAAATFSDWRAWQELVLLSASIPGGGATVEAIRLAIASGATTGDTAFASAFEMSAAEVHASRAADLLDMAWPAAFRNPRRVRALAEWLHVHKLLGASAAATKRLIAPEPSVDDAAIARQLFTGQFDVETLPARLEPVSNVLRSRQRDALVDYVRSGRHLTDSDALLDHFLIDVAMESCMRTSRIRQAISSTQLFVQRCLLNLERERVSPADINVVRWEWMKNYRVWEANRKVFLYPENWIEPELRDDKTELFEQLESDLLQADLTHESSVNSFRKYLEKASELSRPTVLGLWKENDGRGSIRVHIVARDESKPYRHFYRSLLMTPAIGTGDPRFTWTPWATINGEIAGEHLLVFQLGSFVHVVSPALESDASNRTWKVRMVALRRGQEGWVTAKQSGDELFHPMVPGKDSRQTFAFRAQRVAIDGQETIRIDCFGAVVAGAENLTPNTEGLVTATGYDSTQPQTASVQIRVLERYVDELGVTFVRKTNQPFTILTTLDLHPLGTGAPTGMTTLMAYGEFSATGPLSLILPSITGRITRRVILIQVSASPDPARHKAGNYSKAFGVFDHGTGTIHYDIVLDCLDGVRPDTADATRDLEFAHVGSFVVTPTLSLASTTPSTPAILESPIAGTEHFASGYRSKSAGAPLSLHFGSVLTSSRGRFFVSQARGESSGGLVWGYSDGRHSLFLLQDGPGPRYRVVPSGQDWLFMGLQQLSRQASESIDIETLPAPAIGTASALVPLDQMSPLVRVDRSVASLGVAFDRWLPASLYDWEVFFHVPLLIATQLSSARRFEEARRWFHTIFDPTSSIAGDDATRYWRFKPFQDAARGESIDLVLAALARGERDLHEEIGAWRDNPFNPHLVARFRVRAYQWAVVLKYVENLLSWGDQLFRRYTIETLNEATQLYVLAARILGPRPATVPNASRRPSSYQDLPGPLDDFSNAWIALEQAAFPPATGLPWDGDWHGARVRLPDEVRLVEHRTEVVRSIGSLYFCVPPNAEIMGLWDKVDDRLFNIRHCRNIDGIERPLALFEPPIDPALLVRATAAGLDLSAVFDDLGAPMPHHRFAVMFQKATELCAEVKALSGAALAALEKGDAEEMAQLRSAHEITLLRLTEQVRAQQIAESNATIEGLRESRLTARERYRHYQTLLGRTEIQLPEPGDSVTLEPIPFALAKAGLSGKELGLGITQTELDQLRRMNEAQIFTLVAGIFNVSAGIPLVASAAFPTNAFLQGAGHALNAIASAFNAAAGFAGGLGSRDAVIGGYERRRDEWVFQANQALREIQQIDKQVTAAEIRRDIATQERENTRQQVGQAQDVGAFLQSKYSSQQLYRFMSSQVLSLNFRTYQIALQLAKRAERCFQFERGLPAASFVKPAYWDSAKKGLLAGEQLALDLRRMEVAYLESDQRGYELTRHVSLLQLDPMALLSLRQTGRCEFTIPEMLYDMDCPGHFMRRLKSVSLTIPCVTGPYTGVHCTLTLLASSVRRTSTVGTRPYERVPAGDDRFIDDYTSIQSIVTSSGQGDAGIFEVNLNDSRYLPFEGAGTESTWRLELPADFRQFDYDTISDVILHVRYTARDGGRRLRDAATARLTAEIGKATAAGMTRLFSVRHEFPSAWAKFTSVTLGSGTLRAELSLDLRAEHYPSWSQDRIGTVERADLLARIDAGVQKITVSGNAAGTGATDVLSASSIAGLLAGKLENLKPASPVTPGNKPLRLFLTSNTMDDLWLAMTWKGRQTPP